MGKKPIFWLAILLTAACGRRSPCSPAAYDGAVYPFVLGEDERRVGWVRISNGPQFLQANASLDYGSTLRDAHLCISTAPFEWTPPGECPYGDDELPPADTYYLFTVPLADLGSPGCGQTLYVQAQGTVADAESGAVLGSAYAGGFKVTVEYAVRCQEDPLGTEEQPVVAAPDPDPDDPGGGVACP